ncbi:hypothetical protein DDZ18_11000 [Marinicauda salina]|uniref:DUF4159 domain-containing protein n=1 Tax=Marinicauda salina TaxID=2135793 RepID=A0A2U2BRT4_9PROT|nr:DUF4159 domain-containing protein [Marinicauda salina]PWE16727.1 hypothetical protein DDZ18_11000 [Marinicauda salina]
MIAVGPLGFAAPLALLGLLALPVLWLLLRATPPVPREVLFAPLALLRRLAETPQTPKSAPLWLILFRLFIAFLIVIALARPVWRPDDSATDSSQPLLVVVDDGWASAELWPRLSADARSRLEGAAIDGRRAALVTTAPNGRSEIAFDEARLALSRLEALEPKPWGVNRGEAAQRLQAAIEAGTVPARFDTIWISDGQATGGAGDRLLAETLSEAGSLRLVAPQPDRVALGLAPVRAAADGIETSVLRAHREGARTVTLSAVGRDGRALAVFEAEFADGDAVAAASGRLPLDLRNRVSMVRIEGARSAGALQLMDDSFRRPRVGLIEPPGGEDRQPLLSDLHYVSEALSGSAETVRGPLDELIETDPAALVMVDAARTEDAALAAFVEDGGLLLRFAGPRLAARGDDLLPTPLRQGGRLFGGALAWDEPQRIGAFPDDSPFSGLTAPAEARVERQVLAEPGPALDARVWARLDDGTPLVTADRRGEGWIVLFHVTAGPDWSSLPLSGLYPSMLRRVLALAEGGGQAAPSEGAWTLERAIDGFGRFAEPSADARPIPAGEFAFATPGPDTPPGLYRLGAASQALNVVAAESILEPIARDLPGAVYETREGGAERRLAGPILAFALLLLAGDVVIALGFAGRLPRIPGLDRFAAVGLVALLAGLFADPVRAQSEGLTDAEALDRALAVRFAYIATGDAEIDRMSRAGLSGLSYEATRRSAVEPAEPRAVDIETDPILFYPLVYWPVTEDVEALSDAASEKVEAYLQSGGLIVFDTRDAGASIAREGPHPGLARLLESVDVPPLARLPDDHVLGRTFYLLDEYPGRYQGGEVWVEADPDGSSRDGTSGVVIGGADWASAWAIGEDGRPLAPVEGGPFQRELAIRFGVNLAMYALTGNYKADQVHVPAILERLGQD